MSKSPAESFEGLFYPGTRTLINHFGEHDPVKLASLERDISLAAALDAKLFRPIDGNFDLQHMQDIHKRFFERVYPWAGQVRDFPLFKQRPDGFYTAFAAPGDIAKLDEQLKAVMVQTNRFANLERGAYVREMAKVYQTINDMHPFREGNGRTHRYYLEALAERAGFSLKFSKVAPDAWAHAASQSSSLHSDGEKWPGRTDELQKVFAHISQPKGGSNSYVAGREGLANASTVLKLSDLQMGPRTYSSSKRIR